MTLKKLMEDIRDVEQRVQSIKHPGPGDEVDKRALEYQERHECSYYEALKAVLASDSELAQRFYEASFSEETRR